MPETFPDGVALSRVLLGTRLVLARVGARHFLAFHEAPLCCSLTTKCISHILHQCKQIQLLPFCFSGDLSADAKYDQIAQLTLTQPFRVFRVGCEFCDGLRRWFCLSLELNRSF